MYALGQAAEAEQAFQVALLSLLDSGWSQEEQQSGISYIEQKQVEATGWEVNKKANGFKDLLGNCLENPHSMLPAFSSKVEVSWTDNLGRHVVARDAIKPGEVIAVDTAIVRILSPDKNSTNCSHCLALMVRILPCPTCCLARFCSSQCKEAALKSYHRYECKLGLGDLYEEESHSYL